MTNRLDQPSLVIRADASAEIGIGHVMRCIALAQEWKNRGGLVRFVAISLPDNLRNKLNLENIPVTIIRSDVGSVADAESTAAIAVKNGAKWVYCDGYRFGLKYQQVLQAQSIMVAVMDDNAENNTYSADLIVNQNAHACSAMYRNRLAQTDLLLGSKYILLRREFHQFETCAHQAPLVARNVIVSFGGADPSNITEDILNIIGEVVSPDLELHVILGCANPHGDSIRRAINHYAGKITLLENISNMPQLLKRMDLAIAASGSTVWELCYMGIPAIIIPIAENQKCIADALHQQKGAIRVADFRSEGADGLRHIFQTLSANREERQALGVTASRLVDGKGAIRIIDAMQAKTA